jgi:hypothetical protein
MKTAMVYLSDVKTRGFLLLQPLIIVFVVLVFMTIPMVSWYRHTNKLLLINVYMTYVFYEDTSDEFSSVLAKPASCVAAISTLISISI